MNEKEKQEVYIVWGCPASGKTTFVLNNMTSRDIRIDMDALVGALTKRNEKHLDKPHPDYSRVMPVALSVRDTLWQMIASRVGNWERAFVITNQWDEKKIDELAAYLNAVCIYMETSESECIQRAQKDDSRKDKNKEIKLIHEWFRKQNACKTENSGHRRPPID